MRGGRWRRHASCTAICVGVTHFTELRAWQLSNQLRIEVFRFSENPPAVYDRRFCNDMRASSDSVCANISEGFGRYTHREFSHFLVIARGSLAETQDHLLNAKNRKYVKAGEFEGLWRISLDAMRALTALLTYVRTHPTPPGVPPKDHSATRK